jgi:hypothetical protein
MVVLGHSIKTLNATRKGLVAKRIDINSTPKIVSVKEKNIDIQGVSGGRQTVIGIDFEFQTDYKPDIGMIKIAGELIYSGDDNKKIVKEWEKNQKLPQDVDIEVKNFLLRKCLLLGVSISQEMQLPPPLVIPYIRQKKEEKPNYIG